MTINVKNEEVTIWMSRHMPVRLHRKLKMLAAEKRVGMAQVHAEALEIGLGVIEAQVAQSKYQQGQAK